MVSPLSPKQIAQAAQQFQTDLVSFTQTLIQTPSLPGNEDKIASVVQSKMYELGYDNIAIDSFGNVIGHIKGGTAPSLMLNGHLDHVDTGDPNGWEHPPHSGKIVNGHIWGRGAVDMKGPLACMIFAPAILKTMNITPPGDIFLAAPVMEEVGGIGSTHLATHLHTDMAIVGEPSHNTLRRGHRGRVELWVTFRGKSIHASVPHLGINPHFSLAEFLHNLRSLPMVKDTTFGGSNVAPTLIATDQVSPNVTPGEIRLTLDWRNTPTESPAEIVEKIRAVVQKSLLDGAIGSVELATRPFTTYTGTTVEQSAVFPSFELAKSDPLVQHAQKTLSDTLGFEMPVDVWQFATDGGHLMAAGIPTLGFGPGDETLAHTNRERIAIADMLVALRGYIALALTDWTETLEIRQSAK